MKADKRSIDQLLKTARGQIDGILKMVEEDRYCVDISDQLLAVQSILRNVNQKIIEAHITHCVKEAFESGDADEKIDEILKLLTKMTK